MNNETLNTFEQEIEDEFEAFLAEETEETAKIEVETVKWEKFQNG